MGVRGVRVTRQKVVRQKKSEARNGVPGLALCSCFRLGCFRDWQPQVRRRACPSRIRSSHVRTLARLRRRALEFAGRDPWLAFLTSRCGFAICIQLRLRLRSPYREICPLERRRKTSPAFHRGNTLEIAVPEARPREAPQYIGTDGRVEGGLDGSAPIFSRNPVRGNSRQPLRRRQGWSWRWIPRMMGTLEKRGSLQSSGCRESSTTALRGDHRLVIVSG
jgi:hypothetical protein